MKIIKSLVAVSCLAMSAAAGATTWGHDNGVTSTFSTATNTGSLGANFSLTTQSVYCAASVCHDSNDFAPGSSVIRLTAYKSEFSGSATGNVTETTTPWTTSQIELAALGPSTGTVKAFGVRSATPSADDGGGTNYLERGIDNNGYDDVLVIDFLSSGWDVKSVTLGFACTFTASTTNPTSCATTSANVKAWIGDAAPTAFSVSGGVASMGSGFNLLDFGNVGSPDALSAGGGNTSIGENTTFKGQYLVLTGDLTRNIDAFTFKGITADKVTTPPPPGGNSVPVPGSLPLVGLALLALAWVSRRSRGLRAIPIRIRCR